MRNQARLKDRRAPTRGRFIVDAIERIERDKLEAKDPWRAGKFKPGDYLQVEHRSAHGEPVDAVVGMLIGIHRRGLGSSIRLLCHVDGSAVEYQFQLYSPMVTNITVRRPSDRWNRQKKLYQLRKLVHTLSIPAPLRSGESKSDERKAGAGVVLCLQDRWADAQPREANACAQ